MKERPILFSGAMVRAILSGRKTQTRRVVKLRDGSLPGEGNVATFEDGAFDKFMDFSKSYPYWEPVRCPYGEPGDRLWVREEHAIVAAPGLTTGAKDVVVQVQFMDGERRCASLTAAELQKLRDRRAWSLGDQTRGRFMYRSLSRITLEIVSVRVERLQEISGIDAWREGCMYHPKAYPTTDDVIAWYRELWESIHGAGSWAVNPWVWVVEFKKL